MNFWKISTFVLTGICGLGVAYETMKPASAEAQPHMVAALATLKSAKNQLENAQHDKGGHRAKALAATEQAIAETKAGIEYDNTHK